MASQQKQKGNKSTRRHFVYGIVAVAAASCRNVSRDELGTNTANSSAQSYTNSMNTILICSPKSGVIRHVFVANGSALQTGDAICNLDSDDEDRALDRLQALEDLYKIEARVLEPEIVEGRRRFLELNLETARAYVQFAKAKAMSAAIQLMFTPIDQLQTQTAAALIKANAEETKALKQLELFDFSIKQAKERMALVKTQLDKERKFINSQHTRLQIKSPARGKIHLKIASGSFVELGHAIAELTFSA